MILHAFYCNVLNEIERNEVTALFQQLEALCERLDGALSFAGGPNRDFERKSKIYLDGFIIRFESADALKRYAEHPTHKELGAQLCTFCDGGADGIIVFDLEV